MKSRVAALAILILGFMIQGFSLAEAVDKPTLQWARGQQQTITLGGNTKSELWNITLDKDGKTFAKFERSSRNAKGFIVYSVDLSRDFPIGQYEVNVSSETNPTYTTAYVSVLSTIAYDPLQDPKGVGAIAVIAFTLLSLFTGNGSSQSNNEEDASALGSVDKDYLGMEFTNQGLIDRKAFAKRKLNLSIDQLRRNTTLELSSKSPLFSRVISDSSYLQALLGYLVALFPLIAIWLGVQTSLSSKYQLSIVPTNVLLAVALMAIGIFDSFAGLVGFLAYLITTVIGGQLNTVIDIRTMFGLALFWFTPILAAGNIRPLRRTKSEWTFWERGADLLIAPLLASWATKGMLEALNGFAKQETELSKFSSETALVAGFLILIRYLLEDLASKLAPARLEYLNPPKIFKQDKQSYITSIFIKVLLYIFFMFGFFGFAWQILIAIAFLVGPSLIGKFVKGIPNFPILYQMIPIGIPGLIVMALVGTATSNFVNSLPLVAADRSKTILILCALPGLLISLLKLFGKSPKPGDVRWYMRAKYRAIYRIFGPALAVIAGLITIGVLP